jgi:hypothetical protein
MTWHYAQHLATIAGKVFVVWFLVTGAALFAWIVRSNHVERARNLRVTEETLRRPVLFSTVHRAGFVQRDRPEIHHDREAA